MGFTMQLDKVIEMGVDIFDFNYQWENISLFGETIDKEALQNAFIEYYQYYDIAFETIPRFKFALKRLWKKNVGVFNQLIKAMPTTVNLYDNKRVKNGTNKANVTGQSSGTMSSTSSEKDKFSDTPNQTVIDSDETYLTSISKNDSYDNGSSEVASSSSRSSEFEESETYSINDIEKMSKLVNKYENLLYVFLDKFNDLFSTLIIVDNLGKRGLYYGN